VLHALRATPALLAACGSSGGDDETYTPCPGSGSGSGSATSNLVFVMPYKAAPQPAQRDLETPAKISRRRELRRVRRHVRGARRYVR